MRQLLRVLTASAFLICAGPLAAHEFWIDPVKSTPVLNETVPLVIRIGSDFKGDTYPYVRALDRGFAVVDAKGIHKLKTLDGDDPAADYKFTAPGLAIVWHQRAPEPVLFATMARFEENLVEEGHEVLAAQHRAAGKPLTSIRENFSRHAKALVQVGAAKGGSDRAVGMTLELVAEANPYDLTAEKPLPVRLFHVGKPLANTLVKVFNRDDPTSPRRIRTDAEGRIAIDISRPGEYLVAAVHMLPASAADKADWISLWASLTFARR
jgi:hypothetical protein